MIPKVSCAAGWHAMHISQSIYFWIELGHAKVSCTGILANRTQGLAFHFEVYTVSMDRIQGLSRWTVSSHLVENGYVCFYSLLDGCWLGWQGGPEVCPCSLYSNFPHYLWFYSFHAHIFAWAPGPVFHWGNFAGARMRSSSYTPCSSLLLQGRGRESRSTTAPFKRGKIQQKMLLPPPPSVERLSIWREGWSIEGGKEGGGRWCSSLTFNPTDRPTDSLSSPSPSVMRYGARTRLLHACVYSRETSPVVRLQFFLLTTECRSARRRIWSIGLAFFSKSGEGGCVQIAQMERQGRARPSEFGRGRLQEAVQFISHYALKNEFFFSWSINSVFETNLTSQIWQMLFFILLWTLFTCWWRFPGRLKTLLHIMHCNSLLFSCTDVVWFSRSFFL